MERDEKGRFVKGKSGNPATQINGGIAEEMQSRSVASRRKNKTVAEMLRAYLDTPAGDGEHTKGEALIIQAVNNHKKGQLTFRDLKYLTDVLGEATLNIKTDGPQVIVVSEKSVQAADKWSKK